MKKTTTIREKIALRAYYAWLNGSPASAGANWLDAEAIETALAERRAAAATKAAATRRAKTKVPAEMFVAVKSHSLGRRMTAH